MIPGAIKGTLIVAAASLACGALGIACSRQPSGDGVGQMTMAVTLTANVAVNTVNYQVSGNGIMPITGSIDVTSLLHPTAFVSGIPVGSGYAVALDAMSVDGKSTCHGMGTFSVAVGQTAMVNVTLACRGVGSGSVLVGGRFDNCPFVASASSTATDLPLRGMATISASATDYDDADVITFKWTLTPAGLGIIGDFTSPSTTFRCNAPGTGQLAVTVSDGVCGETRNAALVITCKPAPAGDGGTDAAGGTSGDAAGSGGSGGTGGRVDAGGGVDAGHSDAGLPEAAPACVEPATNSAACGSCTASQCPLASPTLEGGGCCELASAGDQALCAAVVSCFTANSATCTSMGDGTNCFCGDVGGPCFMTDGAANGPCTAQVIAAAKTQSAAAIQNQFVNGTTVLGRAVNLVSCRGAFCTDECGIH
jgi:hypothetical protein